MALSRCYATAQPARELLIARFPHLVVDEYQDLGPVLHALVTLLLNAGMTVSAFGDPDQTMFEFQGADPRYLTDLASRDGVTPIRLTLNYRSGSALVAAGRAALGDRPWLPPRPGVAPTLASSKSARSMAISTHMPSRQRG